MQHSNPCEIMDDSAARRRVYAVSPVQKPSRPHDLNEPDSPGLTPLGSRDARPYMLLMLGIQPGNPRLGSMPLISAGL